MAGAVGELDAEIGNHLLVEGREGTVELNDIFFGFGEFGMGHRKSKIAVIGEENESGGIFV